MLLLLVKMGRPTIPLDSVRYSKLHYPTIYDKHLENVRKMQENAQNMDAVNKEKFTSLLIQISQYVLFITIELDSFLFISYKQIITACIIT